MKSVRNALIFTTLVAIFLLLWNDTSHATLKYKRQTGKKCNVCHTGIPKAGDEDPQLTKTGREFKKNGYKLTKDQ